MTLRAFALPFLPAALALPALSQTPQPLTTPEQTVVAYIDAHQQEANDLLAKLVDINSGTHNLEGVRAVAKIMQQQFEDLGFHTQFNPMDQIGRAGDLVATHPCPEGPGKCGKRMLFIGHMDTVFEKSSPFQKFTVNGNVGTGPGSNDMKGGLVDMLYALKALKTAGLLDPWRSPPC